MVASAARQRAEDVGDAGGDGRRQAPPHGGARGGEREHGGGPRGRRGEQQRERRRRGDGLGERRGDGGKGDEGRAAAHLRSDGGMGGAGGRGDDAEAGEGGAGEGNGDRGGGRGSARRGGRRDDVKARGAAGGAHAPPAAIPRTRVSCSVLWCACVPERTRTSTEACRGPGGARLSTRLVGAEVRHPHAGLK